jgi:hypothetical protein
LTKIEWTGVFGGEEQIGGQDKAGWIRKMMFADEA